MSKEFEETYPTALIERQLVDGIRTKMSHSVTGCPRNCFQSVLSILYISIKEWTFLLDTW